jgi:hypothetical protein
VKDIVPPNPTKIIVVPDPKKKHERILSDELSEELGDQIPEIADTSEQIDDGHKHRTPHKRPEDGSVVKDIVPPHPTKIIVVPDPKTKHERILSDVSDYAVFGRQRNHVYEGDEA